MNRGRDPFDDWLSGIDGALGWAWRIALVAAIIAFGALWSDAFGNERGVALFDLSATICDADDREDCGTAHARVPARTGEDPETWCALRAEFAFVTLVLGDFIPGRQVIYRPETITCKRSNP